MRAFTTQPGIPLIEIQKISDNQIRIKQSRYRVLSDRSAYPQTWPIPITLDLNTGSQRISQRVLLDKEQTVINLQLPFSLTRYGTFYPNAGERGYYRWVLKDFPPPHLARLQIREQLGYLDNLEASLQAGAIKPVDFFNQLKSFAMVQHPEVLRRLAQSLSSAKNDLIDDSMTAGFAAYVEGLLLPGLDTIGWEAKTGDGPQTHRARASLFEALGFLSENSPVLERARQKVSIYQQAPDAVDPNLAATWIKLAAIRGDRILFQNYQEHFESEENPVIQQYYLNGLGYFRDKDIALEALAYSLTDDVKPQEWGRIPFTLANHPPLHTTVFDWYKSYYETIRSKVPDHYLHWHVWICAKRDLDVLEQGVPLMPTRKPSIRIYQKWKKSSNSDSHCLSRTKQPAKILSSMTATDFDVFGLGTVVIDHQMIMPAILRGTAGRGAQSTHPGRFGTHRVSTTPAMGSTVLLPAVGLMIPTR